MIYQVTGLYNLNLNQKSYEYVEEALLEEICRWTMSRKPKAELDSHCTCVPYVTLNRNSMYLLTEVLGISLLLLFIMSMEVKRKEEENRKYKKNEKQLKNETIRCLQNILYHD